MISRNKGRKQFSLHKETIKKLNEMTVDSNASELVDKLITKEYGKYKLKKATEEYSIYAEPFGAMVQGNGLRSSWLESSKYKSMIGFTQRQ